MSRENPFTGVPEKSKYQHFHKPSSDLAFVLDANGFLLSKRKIIPNDILPMLEGDSKHLDTLFRAANFTLFPQSELLLDSLNQAPVLDVIRQYRKIDEMEARRISLLFGGVTRALRKINIKKDMKSNVAFVANMTKLGHRRSGEAIAAAMAMYVLMGEPTVEDDIFKGDVSCMATAIEDNPIIPQATEDLGLSQAIRLLGFSRKRLEKGNLQRATLPKDLVAEIVHDMEYFADFPTMGAEFHLSPDEEVYNNFWQRVALLNMSQYQSGSHIPFSRTEEGLREIRMNPSVYPVSTANWNLTKFFLPELRNCYFTMTVNQKETNFGSDDRDLVTSLHGLGNLCYATQLDEVPEVKTPQQVKFGDWYLGQTVRVKEGKFSLTGIWGGNGYTGGHGQTGQLNLCSGFGNLFENLAFYLSMAVVEPTILKSSAVEFYIQKAARLADVVQIDKQELYSAFDSLNSIILSNPKLALAIEKEQEIESKLML